MPIKKSKQSIVDLSKRNNMPLAIDNNYAPVPKIKINAGKNALLVLFTIAVISALVGWWLLSSPATDNKTSVKMVVDSPRSVIAGDPFTIKINYQNIDTSVLKKIQLVFDHSVLWHLQTSEIMPSDEKQSSWQLPDLAVGASQELNLTGVLYGEPSQSADFNFKIYYVPENFSSQFEDQVNFKIKVVQGYLWQKNGLPENLNLVDSPITTLTYALTAGNEATSTEFELFLPEGVSLVSSSPAMLDKKWHFDSWQPGEEKNIALQLASDQNTSGDWQMIAKQGDVIVGQWSGKINLQAPSLQIRLEKINSENLGLGSFLKLKLSLANNGNKAESLNQVKIVADSSLIDWNKVKIAKAIVDKQTIIWSSDGFPGKQLAANNKQTIEFQLPLLSNVKSDVNEDYVIKLTPSASINVNDQSQEIAGQQLFVSVSRPLSATAVARYYVSADNPVGSGPLPPQVGKTTTYQIVWTITAGKDNLNNLKMIATLPTYVDWNGQDEEISGPGQINFNQTTKKITWEIPALSANQLASVAFKISVIPSSSQLNQLLVLTNVAKFSANQGAVGAIVNLSAPLLTSELPFDSWANGQGRVQN